jgi:DNA-directed RNA polymerase subunit RPC12/RpoP
MGEDSKKAEIFCPVCGEVTLVVREPVFRGLRKVGEKLSCSTCGTEFEDEAEVQFVDKRKVDVFSEKDGVRLCLHCVHYIVNPFTQRCMLKRKEVEATDTCERFVRRPEEKKEEQKKSKRSDALKKLFGEEEEKQKPQKPGEE